MPAKSGNISQELTAKSSDIQLARDMWYQILKSFQVNFAFCFEHAYFKRSARAYYKSEKKNLLGFYNQNMTWNAFHVFYILHATPQTRLEQAVPPCLSVSWSILVGRCESIKWDDCPQFEKHYSALHILIITFSIRELGSVPLIPFHPTHSLFVLLETSSHQQLPLLQELTMTFLPLVLILKASDCLDPS